MEIRAYQPGDASALVHLWNQAMPRDGITEQIFRDKVLLDANFDPQGLLVAEEQGALAGWILGLVRKVPMAGVDLEESTGWITAFGVHPAMRRKMVGTALFEAALEFFADRHRRTLFFASYAPNYFVPGIDEEWYPAGFALLQHYGFKVQYSPVAMDKSLVGYEIPQDVWDVEARLERLGFTVAPMQSHQVWPLLEFLTREFDPDWLRAVREALARHVPDHHVMLATGPSGAIVGFALFGGYDHVGERFGPYGVAASQRGTGLGKVLLYRTLAAMARDGLHSAWFLWTGEQEPAGHLYLRAGFAVTRRFHVMVRTLEGEIRP